MGEFVEIQKLCEFARMESFPEFEGQSGQDLLVGGIDNIFKFFQAVTAPASSLENLGDYYHKNHILEFRERYGDTSFINHLRRFHNDFVQQASPSLAKAGEAFAKEDIRLLYSAALYFVDVKNTVSPYQGFDCSGATRQKILQRFFEKLEIDPPYTEEEMPSHLDEFKQLAERIGSEHAKTR